MIQEICSFFEIWNTQTTPFHPQSDGASERSIRNSERDARKDCPGGPEKLGFVRPIHVSGIQTHRFTVVRVFTPCFLEFGREFRLPSDLHEPHTCSTQSDLHSDYAVQLKTRLTQALKTARDTLKVAHSTQKAYYDRWARANTYRVGDRVMWLDKKTRRGRCMKLNRPWTGPWTVVKRFEWSSLQDQVLWDSRALPRSQKASCSFQSVETVPWDQWPGSGQHWKGTRIFPNKDGRWLWCLRLGRWRFPDGGCWVVIWGSCYCCAPFASRRTAKEVSKGKTSHRPGHGDFQMGHLSCHFWHLRTLGTLELLFLIF